MSRLISDFLRDLSVVDGEFVTLIDSSVLARSSSKSLCGSAPAGVDGRMHIG